MVKPAPLSMIALVTIVWLLLAVPLHAADPVEIEINGIEGDPLQNVRETLLLPPGLVQNGKVDRLWLERYVGQAEKEVVTALEPYGYYNARVKVTLETVGPDEYRLRVDVAPGEPVRLAEVSVAVRGAGAEEEKLKETVAGFPLARGSVLVQPTYERGKGALKSRAQELGYLDADFPLHEIRIDRRTNLARILLLMETGSRYYFDGVEITGARQYPPEFLRRYLAFKAGEPFSYAKLGESQLNLTNSERFREVIVTPEKEQSADFRVPVLVQLKPFPRRSLRPGIGYGTDTGARFTIRYRDLNMLQRGHEFFSNLYISERLQGLATGYVIPSALDIKTSTSLQLNLQKDDVTTYTSRLIALELDRNHSFGKGIVGTAYIRLQQEDFTIGSDTSSSRVVLPGVRVTVDRYDNLVRPVEGYRYAADLRGTDQFLGSTTRLIQLIMEGSYLVPLPWRLSLHLRGKGGATFLSDPLSDLPPSLRFFAGGDQSVRGYSYQSLGPTDATGQVVGGKQLLTGSIELERALFASWGVSVFYDAGNAFNSYTSIRLFQGAGVGLHYYTRVGALNLAVARQIGVDHPGFHIHFTVGFEL